MFTFNDWLKKKALRNNYDNVVVENGVIYFQNSFSGKMTAYSIEKPNKEQKYKVRADADIIDGCFPKGATVEKY